MRLKLCITILIILPLTLFGENYSLLSYGEAGWYKQELKNSHTANGEVFLASGFTAAHRKLPFGTLLRVTNLENNQSVTVRINDRGPLEKAKIIDLSPAAAHKIGFGNSKKVKVEIRVIKIGSNKKTKDFKNKALDANLIPTPQIKEFKDISVPDSNIPNNGQFVIQVGAFKLSDNANSLKNSLQGQGFSSFVKNKDNYWRVFIGNFISRTKANSSLNKIKNTIPDAFIKRR